MRIILTKSWLARMPDKTVLRTMDRAYARGWEVLVK